MTTIFNGARKNEGERERKAEKQSKARRAGIESLTKTARPGEKESHGKEKKRGRDPHEWEEDEKCFPRAFTTGPPGLLN